MDKDLNSWIAGYRSAIPGQYTEWNSGSGSPEYSRGISAYSAVLEEAVTRTVARIQSTSGSMGERMAQLEAKMKYLDEQMVLLMKENQELRAEMTRKDNRWGSF